MDKAEVMKEWKEVTALKKAFSEELGKKFPSLCTNELKLLAKVKAVLAGLAKELEAVVECKPEAKPGSIKLVKTGVKIGAKVLA